MHRFTVKFNLAEFENLDQLALLADQDYNLGDTSSWFGEFRGGLYGFYSRLFGVMRHYAEVHAWTPSVRHQHETEYHLSSIMFHMDSALECLVFALNALGWISLPAQFRDVADAKALRKISPLDVIGDATRTPMLLPSSGYGIIFPTLQSLWQGELTLIQQIRDLHDVSKHRRTIYEGGQCRLDSPPEFYELLGVPDVPEIRSQYWPMAEIILKHEPKLPQGHRAVPTQAGGKLLEDIVPSFAALVEATGKAALKDALLTVPLTERQFRSR
jgi:hypothetical protein